MITPYRPASRLACSLALCLALYGGLRTATATDLDDQVQRILQTAPVADAHADTVLQFYANGIDLGIDLPGRQSDLPKLRAGGVGIQMFSIFTSPDYGAGAVARTYVLLGMMKAQLARHADQVELVRTAADLGRIRGRGKLAALFSIEGGHALGSRLANLDDFYRQGVRSLTLTWMTSNAWADSSTDTPRWGGLSAAGIKLVRRMNDLGMIIDVSHTSDDTVRAVLRASRAPILASHSDCAALAPLPRNLKDGLIREIARRGGVIGINFFPSFLDARFRQQNRGVDDRLDGQRQALYRQYRGQPAAFARAWRRIYDPAVAALRSPVGVSRVVDHIDHAVQVAGIDHVGLGSDFDGVVLAPRGLEDAAHYGNLVRALLQRGYREADVLKILGGNERRLYEQVLATAGPARSE